MTKKCSKCGVEKPAIEFNKDKCHKNGLSSKCKQCWHLYSISPERRKKVSEWRKSDAGVKWLKDYMSKPIYKEVRDKSHQTPSGRYTTYKTSAKTRGHKFGISFEEFMTFWNKPCHYCGTDINGIGLDRVDSNNGYLMGNIVPCCPKCNRAKLDMTPSEYFELCEKVVINLTRELI